MIDQQREFIGALFSGSQHLLSLPLRALVFLFLFSPSTIFAYEEVAVTNGGSTSI